MAKIESSSIAQLQQLEDSEKNMMSNYLGITNSSSPMASRRKKRIGRMPKEKGIIFLLKKRGGE